MGKQWKTAGKRSQAGKKGALFTKLSREIQVAVRLAGPHPENNHRLKLALETARSHSLPKDTIDRAISKGQGQKSEDQIEEVIYEGFGPHGIAMIVLCLTDNRVRTVSEIRHLFKKHKGSMGDSGSVMWMFDKVALVQAKKENDQNVEEEAIAAEADDMEKIEDSYIFYGKWEHLQTVRENLIKKGWEIIKAELAYRAKDKVTVVNHQDVQNLLRLFSENPDCKAVFTNWRKQ
ncbi:MAG: YebC/PmpR family DNA-binding transcriptional regulator [Bdellovibrionales bacterium]|nr:YebC/PmpR family DNA-binding transcriptional regulator [Bdellovibrionales bacterium]